MERTISRAEKWVVAKAGGEVGKERMKMKKERMKTKKTWIEI